MRVMVFGTFDNLHPGHLNYFWQARRFGAKGIELDNVELIIIVARDKNVLQIKGKLPHQKERIRVAKVREALRLANWSGRAVLGSPSNQWLVLKKYQPQIVALGYDQRTDIKKLKEVLAGAGLFCKIKRLKSYHPEKYKSSYCRG